MSWLLFILFPLHILSVFFATEWFLREREEMLLQGWTQPTFVLSFFFWPVTVFYLGPRALYRQHMEDKKEAYELRHEDLRQELEKLNALLDDDDDTSFILPPEEDWPAESKTKMSSRDAIPSLAKLLEVGVVEEWVKCNMEAVEMQLSEILDGKRGLAEALEMGLITEQEFVWAVLDRVTTWLEVATESQLHNDWDPSEFRAGLDLLAFGV